MRTLLFQGLGVLGGSCRFSLVGFACASESGALYSRGAETEAADPSVHG